MSAAAEAVLVTPREIASGGIRFITWLARGLAGLRQLAPYAAIELLLPGGSLIALVLWLYRRNKKTVRAAGLSASGQAESEPAARKAEAIISRTARWRLPRSWPARATG